ncbi:MAG: hypothetical protein HS132_14685 [Planctomycetia bacterium]|nr:hypothetical protein [Planctomycetia bacterium]
MNAITIGWINYFTTEE